MSRGLFLCGYAAKLVRKAIRKLEANKIKLVLVLIWFLSSAEKVISYFGQKFLGAVETNFITFSLTPNVEVYHILAFLVTSLGLWYLNYVYHKSTQINMIRYSIWAVSVFLTFFYAFCVANNVMVIERLM